ncbi:uncharacterized protein LOC114729617 [Neltuma alba]|uniref:uncharacterized protein LOC114729617 n=1 Tax=Neltuma alba TaxID=207710 RepID=UPI0010A53697|nr:uncharacterized protein LOC114729617 [Prosopis alba]
MADGKVNLPDDLFSSKTTDGHFSVKDEALGGHGGEKGVVGVLDDLKDQVSSDNSIPLSPQWLYSKPIDARVSSTNTVVGNATDPILKDSWRLDGSQDKKDWRRTVPDVDISRRWREEERETSLLGRRDRRKEDRRPEITSTSDNRALSSDRWHDSRGSGHESRRENKWSSRWGPEDKEKDSRSDKRNDIEKEDVHVEKQSFGVINRAGSERETESRDKWRPRHRMEAQAGAVATYRAAPGFGLEKGRAEASNMRFAPGRGRANINGNLQIGRPISGSPFGSALMDKNKVVLGKPSLNSDLYSYPRGKLLDMYRKQKVDLTVDTMPAGMEHTPTVTQLGSVEPMAFVAPASEEEAVLRDILKGKIISSEVSSYSFRGKDGGSNDDTSGIDETGREGKLTTSIGMGGGVISGSDVMNSAGEFIGGPSNADASLKNIEILTFKEGNQKHRPTIDVHGRNENFASSTGEASAPGNNVSDPGTCQQRQASALHNHANQDLIGSAAAISMSSNLPNDSRSLFEFSCLQQTPRINEQDIKPNERTHSIEIGTSLEELSLCYLDPQGVIQGPFLGIDIILWFEQGFFGTDLPVRLSNAPEGSPFRELGDVMPHLKLKSGSTSGSNLISQSEPSDTSGRNPKVNAHPADYDMSPIIDDQSWVSSQADVTLSVAIHSQTPNQSFCSETKLSDDQSQSFTNFIDQDDNILSKMAGRSNDNSLTRSAEIHTSYTHPSGKMVATEVSGNGTHKEADKLHPFGLLMSELIDGSHLRRAQSSNVSSRLGEEGHLLDPLHDRGAPFGDQGSLGGVAGHPSYKDAWSDEYGINRQFNNAHVGSLEDHYLSHMGPKFNNFDRAENLMLQKLQKERLQQQNSLPSHFASRHTVPDLERFPGLSLSQSRNTNVQPMIQNSGSDYERLMGLQIEQQRQLELQQQHEMHQQQLLQQMKLQQQSQVQQLLLEQFMHQQIPDPNFRQSKLDLMRDDLFDQVQLRRQVLHDLQQNPHSLRHLDPSVEQIIQANIGLNAVQGRQSDLSDLLLQARHGNILPSEQQLQFQQEQLQAQQLSMALRQKLGLEGEQFGRSWPINETGHLLRNSSTHQLTPSAGFNSSDIHKTQHGLLAKDEQLNYLSRNLAEQNHRGFYEPNSLMFERSPTVSAGVPAMNFDSVNASAQRMDLQERLRYMHPSDQFSSLPSQHLQASDELFARHPDAFESSLSGNNGHLENSWTDPRVQLQHLEAGRHRIELGGTIPSANLNMSASAGARDDSSARGLMDVLHQKLGLQSTQSSNADQWHPLSSRSQDNSWHVHDSNSVNYPFDRSQDQQIHLNDPFEERPGSANSTAQIPDHLVMHVTDNLRNNEKLPTQSRSGSIVEEQSFLSANKDTLHPSYRNPLLIGKSTMEKDLLELEANKGQRHEFLGGMKPSLSGITDLSDQLESTMSSMELPATAQSRHSSLCSAGTEGGAYNREMGLSNSRGEEIPNDRMSPSTKVLDSHFQKRPPVSRILSSPDVQSDQSAVPHASDGRREPSGNSSISAVADAQTSGRKEVRFRRTSSISDGVISETSFIDMLKKPVLNEMDAASGPAGADSSDGGSQAARSSKKKGKKGKQIDPSLLGFKVSSNRIMMGEIQRPED